MKTVEERLESAIRYQFLDFHFYLEQVWINTKKLPSTSIESEYTVSLKVLQVLGNIYLPQAVSWVDFFVFALEHAFLASQVYQEIAVLILLWVRGERAFQNIWQQEKMQYAYKEYLRSSRR